jgi:general stress protein 26
MSIENKTAEEGLIKLKDLAEGIDFCMFCTALKVHPIEVSPMSVQEVDEDGNIWFLASKESQKYSNIANDKQVQLMFSDISNFKFLSVFGDAEISQDEARIDKYWNLMVKGWFEKGREDPNIILIKVIPSANYYWDTKSHKMISFAKTLIAAVTGTKNDQGVEGEIKLP